MIELTRPNGRPVMVNCDLLETIEENGETVVTLTTGNALIVRDRMRDIEEKVVAFRRKVRRPFEPGS